MKCIQILFIFISNLLFANLPDSIRVSDRSSSFFSYPWVNNTEYSIVKNSEVYVVYQTYKFIRNERTPKGKKNGRRIQINTVSFKEIEQFIQCLEDTNYAETKLRHFGVTKEIVERSVNSQFEYIRSKYYYWKDFQVDYIKKELSEYSNYQNAFDSLYPKAITPIPSSKFSIKIYKQGEVEMEILPSSGSYGLPWWIDSRKSYNPQIGLLFSELLPRKERIISLNLNGTTKGILFNLTYDLYNKKWVKVLDSLAVNKYHEEFSELALEFDIIEISEYGIHGRYVSMINRKEPVFRIVLKNNRIPHNMELVFFISKQGNSLYPRDSLLNNYTKMLDRVKEVKFLMEYLKQDTTSKLTLFYFDNNGMNDYLKDSFNRNKKQWENFDKGDIEDEFKHLYCGCNFRFKDEYLNKVLMFELTSELGSSIWYLLPDGTPVLHHFSGNKVYNYTSEEMGTKSDYSIQYVCKKFDDKGNLILD
ncbi:MAG: hypothetical protein ACPGSD_02725 [Flavobacteriales bacterium]